MPVAAGSCSLLTSRLSAACYVDVLDDTHDRQPLAASIQLRQQLQSIPNRYIQLTQPREKRKRVCLIHRTDRSRDGPHHADLWRE